MSNNTVNTDKTVDFLSYVILGLFGFLGIVLLVAGYFWMFSSQKSKDVALKENAQASVIVSETVEKKDIKPEPQENTVAKEVPPIIIEPNEVQEPIEQVEDEKQILLEQNESSIEEAIKPLNQFNKTQEEIEQALKDARLHSLSDEYKEAYFILTELIKNGVELDIEYRFLFHKVALYLSLQELANRRIESNYVDLIDSISDDKEVEKFDDIFRNYLDGCAFQEQTRFEEAIEKFDYVVKMAPFDIESKTRLAACRMSIIMNKLYVNSNENISISEKEFESIVKDMFSITEVFESAIKLEPRFDRAYNELALAYIFFQKFEKAKEAIETACRLAPYATDYIKTRRLILERYEKETVKKQPVTIMAFNRLKLGTSRQEVEAMFGECDKVQIETETIFCGNWNVSPPAEGYIMLQFEDDILTKKMNNSYER